MVFFDLNEYENRKNVIIIFLFLSVVIPVIHMQ